MLIKNFINCLLKFNLLQTCVLKSICVNLVYSWKCENLLSSVLTPCFISFPTYLPYPVSYHFELLEIARFYRDFVLWLHSRVVIVIACFIWWISRFIKSFTCYWFNKNNHSCWCPLSCLKLFQNILHSTTLTSCLKFFIQDCQVHLIRI